MANPAPAPLSVKLFFRFPELLLLISMLIGPIAAGNSTVDIQLHDTYYVFTGVIGKVWNLFFLYMDIPILFSWLLLVLLRRRGLMASPLRWIYVCASMVLVTGVVVGELRLYQLLRQHSFAGMDNAYMYGMLASRSLLLFVLLHATLWIHTTILLLKRKTPYSTTV